MAIALPVAQEMPQAPQPEDNQPYTRCRSSSAGTVSRSESFRPICAKRGSRALISYLLRGHSFGDVRIGLDRYDVRGRTSNLWSSESRQNSALLRCRSTLPKACTPLLNNQVRSPAAAPE